MGSPLTNGNHAFTVTATDSAGNVSSPSNTFNIVVDTAAPTAPIVIQAFDDVGPVTGALVNGQSTNDNQPLLSGTAEANSIVSISDNGVFLDTVTASATGTWSYTPPARNDGQHVFTATSTDAAGNVGAVSGSFTLTIDTSTPVTPALSTVYDDVAGGVFNANLTNGQVTNDARPAISGTGEVGTTITILDGGTPIGTVTVPAGGNWTFTPTTPLTAGLHTFTITATDAAGNVSTASAGFAITVDTTAPTTPVITSIVDDVAGGVFNNPLANNQAVGQHLTVRLKPVRPSLFMTKVYLLPTSPPAAPAHGLIPQRSHCPKEATHLPLPLLTSRATPAPFRSLHRLWLIPQRQVHQLD